VIDAWHSLPPDPRSVRWVRARRPGNGRERCAHPVGFFRPWRGFRGGLDLN
jgi:hypothetical protein